MKPTEAQVKAAEKAHSDLLATIVKSVDLWFKLLSKYASLPSDNPDKVAFKKWTTQITNTIGGWFARQHQYEAAGISKKFPYEPKDFFDAVKFKSLKQLIS